MAPQKDTLDSFPQIVTAAECREVIKPSPELIQDEYEHNQNENGMVYILSNGLELDVTNIRQHLLPQLVNVKYQVTDEDNGLLYRTKKDLHNNIDLILDAVKSKKPSCLIIFFYGRVIKNDRFLLEEDDYVHTKDILNKFTADKCPELKNKPKIFIFEGRSYQNNNVCRDNHQKTVTHPYDIPAEADILFVFKLHVDDTDNKFLKEFCNNMEKMGAKEDIKTLLTLINDLYVRPLIISTLTRKFYLIPNEKRGYLLERHRQNEEMLNILGFQN